MNELETLEQRETNELSYIEACILGAGARKSTRAGAIKAAEDYARLQRIEQAAINLQSRLDEHFGGTGDWKEQAELRAALKGDA
jgi:hypothetical protein